MLCKSLLNWFAVAFGFVTVESYDVSSVTNFGFEVKYSASLSTRPVKYIWK